MKSKLKTEMLKQMFLKNKMTESMMEIPSSDSDSSSEESEGRGDLVSHNMWICKFLVIDTYFILISI